MQVIPQGEECDTQTKLLLAPTLLTCAGIVLKKTRWLLVLFVPPSCMHKRLEPKVWWDNLRGNGKGWQTGCVAQSCIDPNRISHHKQVGRCRYRETCPSGRKDMARCLSGKQSWRRPLEVPVSCLERLKITIPWNFTHSTHTFEVLIYDELACSLSRLFFLSYLFSYHHLITVQMVSYYWLPVLL